MKYNGVMAEGKQIGLRLSAEEVARLDTILKKINQTNDTTASNVLREFLGLRPRKVTTEEDLLFFSGQRKFLSEPTPIPVSERKRAKG
jgi:hypothetical protein